MVVIGWLADNFDSRIGGAELSERSWVRACPPNVSIVYCPPTKRPPPVDVFYVGNCTKYGGYWAEELAKHPVVKMVHDPWWEGSPVLRRWLLDNTSLLLFHSPVQQAGFNYPFDLPVEFIPDTIDIEMFADAAQTERSGNVFIGRCAHHKGLHRVVDWALRNDEELDLYGAWAMNFRPGELPATIRYHGYIDYSIVPQVLGRAQRFIFMPTWIESYGRIVVEAMAAGCELVLDGDIGCLWWMKNRPDDMNRGSELLWQAMESIIG